MESMTNEQFRQIIKRHNIQQNTEIMEDEESEIEQQDTETSKTQQPSQPSQVKQPSQSKQQKTTPPTKLPTINDTSELQTNEEDEGKELELEVSLTDFDDNEDLGLKSQDDTKPIDQSPNPSTPAEQDQQQDTSTPQQPGKPIVPGLSQDNTLGLGEQSEATVNSIIKENNKQSQQQSNIP